MTSKLSFAAFVPFSLAAIAIKVIQLFFMDESGFFYGFNSLMLSYLAVACSVIVLLFAVIFCLVDKKTASFYTIKRNFATGLFGLLMAGVLACDGANRALVLFRSVEYGFVEIVDVALTLLCAIVFVVLGLNHFIGNGSKALAVFYLVPAIWSGFRLVACFLEFTTVSIAVTDITILACYIFATLFLFNYAMIIALVKGKSPVRSAFIYGLPAVTVLLAYSFYEIVYSIMYMSVRFDAFSHLESFEFGVLALYILSFVVELAICVKRKDEVEFIEDEIGSDDEVSFSSDVLVDGTEVETTDDSIDTAEETSNFAFDDMREVVSDDILEVASDDTYEDESDETCVDVENTLQNDIEEITDTDASKEENLSDVKIEISDDDTNSKLDRINKLIAEITGEE